MQFHFLKLKRHLAIAAFALLPMTFAMQEADAGLPKAALGALAVSPDGTTIAAAGDNRVMYLLDATTLEVKERIWIKLSPTSLYWTRDGKTLVMQHTDDVLTLFDTKTWEPRGEIPKFDKMQIARGAERVVTAVKGERNDDHYKTILRIHDLNSGEMLKEAELDYEIVSIATSPDASMTVIATREVDNEAEPKAEISGELKDLEKEIAEKKGDGKTMDFAWFDADLKQTSKVTSWYSTYYTDGLHIHDGKTYLLAFGTSAVISDTGDAELFNSYGPNTNYGYAFTPDNSVMVSGGLASGTLLDIASRTQTDFDLGERLPGWPEYIQGVAFAPDGTIIGGTSAYRVLRMKPDGTVELVKPVF
ncbi:MAG: WD40 repeat domain-containing protein [Nitratireductor sp.]